MLFCCCFCWWWVSLRGLLYGVDITRRRLGFNLESGCGHGDLKLAYQIRYTTFSAAQTESTGPSTFLFEIQEMHDFILWISGLLTSCKLSESVHIASVLGNTVSISIRLWQTLRHLSKHLKNLNAHCFSNSQLSDSMENHGKSLKIMENHGKSWKIMTIIIMAFFLPFYGDFRFE